jgi:predicted permease
MRPGHWFYTVPLRLRSLFRRRRVEQELDEELQYHLDHKIEEYVAKGLTPAQSRRAALRDMDGLTQHKEVCRDSRGLNLIDNTLRDIRFAIRVLAKAPGFTTVAVLTLALAIGANAVVFGVMNGMILRPLNVPRATNLWGIEHRDNHSMFESYPDYIDLRDRNRSFESLAAFCLTLVGVDTGAGSTRASGMAVSGNYFDSLGIQPYLGRLIHATDEHGPNSAPYIVLSYGFWHDHFSDDRNVLGRIVRLNKHPFTVVGVAPPDFHGTLLFLYPEFYVPMVNAEQVEWGSLAGTNLLSTRTNRWVFMTLGHLKEGVTPAQAIADLNSIGDWLERTYPKEHGTTRFQLARPGLYGNYLAGPARAFLGGLLLLAGLILLAACANLGNLFAARAADRAREVALRLALGAGRSRILRALFTEAILISLMGGTLGLTGSIVLLRELSVWRPLPQMNMHVPVDPDIRVYAIALGLAVVSGILFGMVPVRQVLRTDPYQIVKGGSKVTGGRRIGFRDLLLVAQIAICAVLVTSSMVAVRGLVRSLHADFGFEPSHTLLVDADMNMSGIQPDAVPLIQKRMLEAAEQIPGVASAALVDWPPLINTYAHSAPIFADDAMDLAASNAAAHPAMYRISAAYFRASGTTLLAGRAFTAHDDETSPRVAVVNREFAQKMFGSVAGALGGHFKTSQGARVEVVGVAENGKYANLTEDQDFAMFVPMVQSPSSETNLVIRSDRDPQQLAAAVRTTLRDVDAGLSLDIGTWSKKLDAVLFPARIATVALGILGVMGAMLAVTGIFGMAAYAVSRRKRELGIRIAIGATGKEVLWAGLGRALRLLAFGSAAGLILGMLASQMLGAIVYQATPRDPVVMGGVILAMAIVGLSATWIPAQRALSLDPVTLLREE